MSQAHFSYQGSAYTLRTMSERDYIHQQLVAEQTFFEIRTLEFIRARRLHGVYFDVGANIGNHTLYFANECHAEAVLAVDGSPHIAPLLTDNLRRNLRPGKPALFRSIFISHTANVFFHSAGEENVGCSFVTEAKTSQDAVPAAAVTLDSLCATLARLDVVKIDVENHELEVLQSGEATLRRLRPDLCIEVFHMNLPAVSAYLESLGYYLLITLSNDNRYFVYLPSAAWTIYRAIRRLPFPIWSRLHWRWAAFVDRFRLLQRRRQLCTFAPAESGGGFSVIRQG